MFMCPLEVHCGHQASFIIIIFIIVSVKEMSQGCVMYIYLICLMFDISIKHFCKTMQKCFSTCGCACLLLYLAN